MRLQGCLKFAFIALMLLEAPSKTLREASKTSGVLVGTAVRPSLLSEAAYSETLAREFSMVEPEDAMKWWIVRASGESFDFQKGDEIVRYAQAHDLKVRGHCLVWDHNNPKWLTDGKFSPAQMSHLLEEHIKTEMKHYLGQVFAWDVVNEALDETGDVKDSPWYNQPKSQQVVPATRYDHQQCWH